MANHQDPKPNSIAERFKFNNRDRKPEKSVAEYIAELRRLAKHCNYVMILLEMLDILQDQLDCGLKHERIQQCLPSEGDTLKLEKAIDTAQAMESAIKQLWLIRSTQGVKEHREHSESSK